MPDSLASLCLDVAGFRWGSLVLYQFGPFQVDDQAFRLSSRGDAIPLEPKALHLLLYLLRHPGRLLSKQELLDEVWPDANVGENALTRCVAQLRKALVENSRDPQYIATVPTVGYRFAAEVKILDAPADAAHAPVAAAAPALPRRVFRWRVALAGGVALLVLALVATRWIAASRTYAVMPIHSLAVLPLENLSGDPSQEYFAAGATEELTTELARIPGLQVVTGSAASGEGGKRVAFDQVARELNVDALVVGSVVRTAGKVRINASLVDARTQRRIWASSSTGDAEAMLALEAETAREIASHARLALLSPADGGARTVNPAAHDLYLRGLYFYHQRNAVRSAGYFQQAIDADPLYSSAYAGLAQALNSEALLELAPQQEVMPRAVAAARKAIELDPRNGEAYIALASVETAFTWDWNDAQHNLALGNELSPNNSVGLMTYGLYLQEEGRAEEGVQQMRRAAANDPLSFFVTRQFGASLYYARRYDEALAQLEHAREMHTGPPNVVDNWETWIYEQKGMHDQAIAHNLRYVQDNAPGSDTAALRQAYARGGWKAYWQARLASFEKASGSSCQAYYAALTRADLGEKDKALQALTTATTGRCFWVSHIRVDPMLDPLRADPRFVELEHQIFPSEPH